LFSYQIGGAFPPERGIGIVDRDRHDTPAAGAYNVCYINAFQSQADEHRWWLSHHRSLLLFRRRHSINDGEWNEHLLDTSTARKRAAPGSIIGKWMAGCAKAGFNAVEPDNLDSWSRSQGALTVHDNLALAARLARRAHALGLAIAQKNAAEISARGRKLGFDFAIAEECQAYSECDSYTRVYGDHVIEIEYPDNGGRAGFTRACGARISSSTARLAELPRRLDANAVAQGALGGDRQPDLQIGGLPGLNPEARLADPGRASVRLQLRREGDRPRAAQPRRGGTPQREPGDPVLDGDRVPRQRRANHRRELPIHNRRRLWNDAGLRRRVAGRRCWVGGDSRLPRGPPPVVARARERAHLAAVDRHRVDDRPAGRRPGTYEGDSRSVGRDRGVTVGVIGVRDRDRGDRRRVREGGHDDSVVVVRVAALCEHQLAAVGREVRLARPGRQEH